MTRRTLFRDFDVVATMDAAGREIPGGFVLVEGNRVVRVGEDPAGIRADEVVLGAGKVLLPGFVNTHHHLYQSLFRCVPGAANAELFEWLVFLYKRWKGIDEEAARVSAAVASSELLLSGATTTSDHCYLFPRGGGAILDADIEGARWRGSAFTLAGGRCRCRRRTAGCRRTAWCRRRPRSSPTAVASSSDTTIPRRSRCFGSRSRPARRFP